MTEAKSKKVLWYTRREGVVRGPYPEKQVSRYILLGRIRDSDELRPDGGEWQQVCDCPDLIPDVLKLPPSEANRQKLLIARMREDERRPGDRRERAAYGAAQPQERRGRAERRRAEAPLLLRHRELKYEVSHVRTGNARLYRYPLAFTALVLLGFLLGFMLKQEQPDLVPPDCAAQPRPGVNWNYCNLSGLRSEQADLLGARVRNARLDAAQLASARLAGADLEYSSLNLSNLQAADLSHANLRGVALRGSDLRNARLVEANLSYANLSGARLEGADLSGAILDHTIWTDQRACAAGSVGECKRLLAAPPAIAQ
jgi:hypothetical protein